MSVLRLCSACRHQVVPVRPRPFAPRERRSAGGKDTVNKHLEDEQGKRLAEEQRVTGNLLIDSEPRYFPWCRKLTVSKQEAAEIRDELLKGDDARARREEAADRILIDYAHGAVLPIYVVCARANPEGECAEFEQRHGGGP